MDNPTVLIVEDVNDWQELFTDVFTHAGWRVKLFQTVPQALYDIDQNITRYDFAVVDKGGSGFWSGTPDIIGHRDGLRVLAELMKEQPSCVRILATAEPYTPGAFDSPELGVQIFFDKRKCWIRDLFRTLETWHRENYREKPILIREKNFGGNFGSERYG